MNSRRGRKGGIVHIGFELGMTIKGIDGLLEILGGFSLLYLNPKRMENTPFRRNRNFALTIEQRYLQVKVLYMLYSIT